MKSQYEIIYDIITDPKVNWIKVNYAGKAVAPGLASARVASGETVNAEKKASIMSDRMTSSQSTSLLISMAKESGSRADDSYGFRSMKIADLDPETFEVVQNIDSIEYCENFKKGWITVELAGSPLFPEMDDTKEINEFVTLFKECASLILKKDALNKILTKIKKNLNKNEVYCQMGHNFFKKAPEGTTEIMVDELGIEIKKVRSNGVGFQLEMINPPVVKVGEYKVDDIVKLKLEIDELSDEIKSIQKNIRSKEAGLIERCGGQQIIKVAGEEFKVNPIKTYSYDYTEKDTQNLKDGINKMKSVPVKQSKWTLEPVHAPEVEVEEVEKAEV
jgi:hypothetical protein